MAERVIGSVMRMFNTSRFQQLRASRLVVAIFALGLLGFSVAPCHAMPQHQNRGTSHHESMPAGGCGHCAHAQTSLDQGCPTVAAPNCASGGPAILERQGAEPQPVAASPPAFPDIEPFPSDDGPFGNIRARDLPTSHASLQQRYCSYLK